MIANFFLMPVYFITSLSRSMHLVLSSPNRFKLLPAVSVSEDVGMVPGNCGNAKHSAPILDINDPPARY
jgi:hypothetical protein